MDKADSATVHFQLLVTTLERDGHWVARTPQTDIFAYGETRSEAEELVVEANEILIRDLKAKGSVVLGCFMKDNGISYRVGEFADGWKPTPKPFRVPPNGPILQRTAAALEQIGSGYSGGMLTQNRHFMVFTHPENRRSFSPRLRT